jgi:hypothetical protein
LKSMKRVKVSVPPIGIARRIFPHIQVGLAKPAMLGAREQDRGCAEREVGRGARGSKTRERKGPSASRVASKAKAKRRLWKRERVPHPRKGTRPKSSSMKKEWAVAGQAAKLRRKSAQSARTTTKKANVGNARDQASASIARS